jgi:lysozyme
MTRALGTDVSFYQDDPNTPAINVNFDVMHLAGAAFVIIRAGQWSWVDRDFAKNWKNAKGVLPRGSYWFYDSRGEPKAQAQLWISTFGGDFGELPLFADFEDKYGGSWGRWQDWYTFLEEVRRLAPNKEIGIYTAYYYFRSKTIDAGITTAQLDYFKQYPLWVANYGVTTPLIPKPWTAWTFWQFTDKGDGTKYGAESLNIDLNYYNGTEAEFRARFGLDGSPVLTPTHKGIWYSNGRAYGTDYVVHVVDLKQVNTKIRLGFVRVDTATLGMGADVGINNVGWGTHPDGAGVPNDLLYADGVPIQANPIDYRKDFSINMLKDGTIRFDKTLTNPYNVIGFDRIIGRDGAYNTEITDTSRAQRTVYGRDRQGRLVVLCSEGRITNQAGLTFRECWDILQAYDVTDAGNADGGNSTCVMNRAISNETLIQAYRIEYRAVVAQTLFYEREEQQMKYTITPIYAEGMKYRPDHNTNNTALSGGLAFGAYASGDVLWTADKELKLSNGTVYQKIGDQWLEVGPNKWVAVKHMGKAYCTLTVNEEPTPDPLPQFAVTVKATGYKAVTVDLEPE